MKTTMQLFNGGKITVPAPIRRELGVEDGDLLEIDVQPVAQHSERGYNRERESRTINQERIDE